MFRRYKRKRVMSERSRRQFRRMMLEGKSKKIVAKDDDHLVEIVKSEIARLGNNADLNHIDVSKVDSLEYLFGYFPKFNGDISKWDVSNVKYMGATFQGSSFNGDISKWDVRNVIDIEYMFEDSKCECDISKWKLESFDSENFEDKHFSYDLSDYNRDSNIDESYQDAFVEYFCKNSFYSNSRKGGNIIRNLMFNNNLDAGNDDFYDSRRLSYYRY